MPDETQAIRPAKAVLDASATRSLADPAATTGAENTDVPTPTAPLPSEQRYTIGDEIARGGMGAVHRATDTVLRREVAIKVLLARFGPASGAAARFADEARITAHLQHPAIPPVHDLGTLPDGRPFLAMKLIDGDTLERLLAARSEPADERGRFVAAFEQICQAIAFAHAHNVIHRDLKPANVMVGAFGEVQVMDWGLAKVLLFSRDPKESAGDPEETTALAEIRSLREPGGSETQTGSVLGTPAFMPPEQAIGALHKVNARSDVFGLGAILAVILTGKPPFAGGSAETTRLKAAQGKISECFARLDASGTDPELVSLCKRCLAPNPDERPADAGEVAELVAAYRTEVEQRLRAAERKQAAAEAKTAEQRKRRRVQLVLAAVVGLLLTGVGAFGWWQDRQTKKRAADHELAESEKRTLEERAEGEKRVLQERAEAEKQAIAFQQQLADERQKAVEQSRLERNGMAVASLITKCEHYLRLGDEEASGEALREAVQRFKEGGAEASAPRLARCRADHELLSKLDAVDRYAWTATNGHFPEYGFVAALWLNVFDNSRVVWYQAPPAEAAPHVQRSLIKDRLLTTLDSWFALQQSKWLRDVLRATDPDPFRESVRDAVMAADTNRLRTLVSQEKELERQPLRFIVALGRLRWLPAEQVRAVLEIGLRIRANDLSILMQLATSYDTGKPETATARTRWFQAAVAAHPRNAAARVGLATVAAETNDAEGALTHYREAIRLDPTLPAAHNNLANLLTKRNDLDGAVTHYREAIKFDSKAAPAHFNLALVLVKKGDTDGAIASLRDAIKLDPNLASAHLELADLLRQKGKLDDAITAYREAIRLDPNRPGAHVNLGIALSNKKDLDGAIAAYKEGIRLDPKLAPAHYNLALALKAKGDRNGAIAAYREVLRLDPALPNVNYNLGTVLALNGDIDGAMPHFREAIRRDPKYAPAHFNLGVALAGKGELEDAAACIREAARLDPKEAMYSSALAQVEKVLKEQGPKRAVAPPPREVKP